MQALRGTQDILPDNIYKWNHVESVIKELCALYGYSEIRTPMFEDTKLFAKQAARKKPPAPRQRDRNPKPDPQKKTEPKGQIKPRGEDP